MANLYCQKKDFEKTFIRILSENKNKISKKINTKKDIKKIVFR